jgi:predicted MPP superfamily phosphohydrolase
VKPDEDLFNFELPARPSWLKARVRSLLNFVGGIGITVATGGYARRVSPYHVEYTRVPMPLRGLPETFEGFRMVQVTDLHTGRCTPVSYLQQVIEHVNEMRPDLVCVTGDLVSHDPDWVDAACNIVAGLKKPVLVTFGNHDYSPTHETWASTEVADAMQARLQDLGVTVLRNKSMPIERGGGRIWIVGLEDVWSGRFSPAEAFAGVNIDEPVIALSHSPDSVFALEKFGAQWIVAGHTHGGQLRIPILGPLFLPVKHKEFDKGEFRVGRARMYVSRGVGCKVPARFRCRPEVTTFVLTAAAD